MSHPQRAIDANRRAYLESVGRRVRTKREALRLSQRQLASLVGKRQGSISKLELGRLDPSFGFLWDIAGALRMSLEELGSYPAIVPPFPEPARADEAA